MSNQDTSLFTNNTGDANQAPPSDNGSSSDPIADLLGQIKNEQGAVKYNDVTSALNGLKHSQEFIPKLQNSLKEKEAEIERLRKEAERVSELERVIESMSNGGSSNTPTPKQGSEVDVVSLVDKVLTQREQAKVAKSNYDLVVQKVSEAFGAEAEKQFYGKAQELGMSVAEFDALASRSPKSVLALMGIKDAPKPSGSPSYPGVNTAGLNPPTDTFITRNSKPFSVGATSQQVAEELVNARKLVEELHGSGKTIHDLTNPKTFFKHFG